MLKMMMMMMFRCLDKMYARYKYKAAWRIFCRKYPRNKSVQKIAVVLDISQLQYHQKYQLFSFSLLKLFRQIIVILQNIDPCVKGPNPFASEHVKQTPHDPDISWTSNRYLIVFQGRQGLISYIICVSKQLHDVCVCVCLLPVSHKMLVTKCQSQNVTDRHRAKRGTRTGGRGAPRCSSIRKK